MTAGFAVGVVTVALGVVVLVVAAWTFAADRRRGPAPAHLEDLASDDHHHPESALDEFALDEFAERLARPFVERIVRPVVARIVAAVGSITPSDHRIRVRNKLAQAGLDAHTRPEEVIAAQGIGVVVGLVVGISVLVTGWLSPAMGLGVLLALVAIGAFCPMAWLSRQVTERTEGIRRDLPETLDLLAISVEAGLGLEGAMEVVVDGEDGPLARELERTLQEMELGLSRRDALTSLKQRAQVPELSTFVQALVQADALGMPLARVLKIQADEMRTRRRQWAREKAGKLPVKILFPLVACIFPAILVVILGPAMSQIGEAF